MYIEEAIGKVVESAESLASSMKQEDRAVSADTDGRSEVRESTDAVSVTLNSLPEMEESVSASNPESVDVAESTISSVEDADQSNEVVFKAKTTVHFDSTARSLEFKILNSEGEIVREYPPPGRNVDQTA